MLRLFLYATLIFSVIMMQPLVSVVMLTYNQKNMVARALDSVLSQQCSFSYEILIGDDASDDGTQEILTDYAQKNSNIILFFQKTNVGVTKNAYDVLMQAKGRYVASCEGDDFWCDEKKLQKQVDFLEGHPEYVGCAHDVNIVNEKGIIYSKKNPTWVSRKRDYSYKNFKGIYLPGQSCSIVRRNIYLDKEKDFSLLYRASRSIGDRTTILLSFPYGKYYRLKDRMACYSFSFAKNTKSITAKDYIEKKGSYATEWVFTNKLEEYAKEHFDFKVNFDPYRHSLFFSSIIFTLRGWKKDGINLTTKDIFCSADNKLGYLFALPVWFVIKLFRWIKIILLKKSYINCSQRENV